MVKGVKMAQSHPPSPYHKGNPKDCGATAAVVIDRNLLNAGDLSPNDPVLRLTKLMAAKGDSPSHKLC
jgi:hypothetical protein